MFCITLEPKHINFIKKLNYIPVVLGEKKFSDNCFSDKKGESISSKNKYYGEYTFHYWLWKNYLNELNDDWIGFCQYRKFWQINNDLENININSLENNILKSIPDKLKKNDVLLGNPFYVNKRKTMKFIKKGFPLILSNPTILFNEKKRNIKFHFDLMHGRGNLDKAIDLLGIEDKKDFEKFVNTEVSFNPHNMFLCKSKKILSEYYRTIFPWLKSCEKVFGFENLHGYGLTRIYGFLAERFMSYWFKKNTNFSEMPILFYDINNDLT